MAVLITPPMTLALPQTAVADRSMRCQGRLVSIGAFQDQVEAICGKPDHIDQWEGNPKTDTSRLFDYETERYLAPKLLKGPILTERWTYDLGSNRFIRHLIFVNGELIKIETGEKGGD